jgi:hypothetical protein
MERIGVGLPTLRSVEDLGADPVDLARLTFAEQQELCRLMGQVQQVGLAGLSDEELERFCCLRIILDGEDYEPELEKEVACD